MTTTGRNKQSKKPGGGKRTTTRVKQQTPAPQPSDAGEAEGSVQQALATTQSQIDQSLQEIRREMASFQSQVLEAVKTVHSQQERGLAGVRQAMEGALHQTAKGSGAESLQPTAETRAEESDDDDEPGAPMRAVAAGVENVHLAVAQATRALDEVPPTSEEETDASVHEGMTSVETAVHGEAEQEAEADATHESEESVRATVTG